MLGPVLVDRTSVKEGKPRDLRVNKQLTRARVRPTPAAFRSSARFNKEHHRWVGPLYTSLPGDPKVHLAGPRFRAELNQSASGRQRPIADPVPGTGPESGGAVVRVRQLAAIE